MLVVVALGGNALLRRGEPLTVGNQRANVRLAATAIAGVIGAGHRVVICHGNGPQVGLLALQGAAYMPEEAYPLDVLGAETEGMIGYLIEQELMNTLAPGTRYATLLTQVEVDRGDPAFLAPSKPIGPVYRPEEAERVRREQGWAMVEEAAGKWRRVVPSPLPRHILQIDVIRMLVEAGVIVVCAGGGGIPTVRLGDGHVEGVEAVIDKDRAAGLLAAELGADALLMLTDVEAVFAGWGTADQRPIRRARPEDLKGMPFAAGSMGPKVDAASDFARRTGGIAGIGKLNDAAAILAGEAGTLVSAG